VLSRPPFGAAPLTPLGAYEADRSPLDRGPAPARVVPYGRVPFVPGAAIVMRRHLRFDETLKGGEDVEFVWRGAVRALRARSARRARSPHRSREVVQAPRLYYGRTAAGIAKHHPGEARPLNVSPWTTAAWVALAAKRPLLALAIVGVATTLTARHLEAAVPDPTRTAIDLVARGSWHSGRVVADALTRAWWPLSAAAALRAPRAPASRSPRRSRPSRRSNSPTISPTASASGRAASGSARSTRFCPQKHGLWISPRFKGYFAP